MHVDSENLLLTEHSEGVAILTLNRPAARNALSMPLLTALRDALDRVAADRSVRCVILRGNGPAFCAGHDLRELRAGACGADAAAVFAACSETMLRLAGLPVPVIAQVHGIATAAGCQLVATCDLAVCAADARFATPGVRIGLFCTTPGVALARAVGRKAALDMLFGGEPINAEQALRIGLVNRVVPPAQLDAAVRALAAQIASTPRAVLALGKAAFARQTELDLASAYAYASGVMAENLAMPEAAEGIDAFLQKRPPRWAAMKQ